MTHRTTTILASVTCPWLLVIVMARAGETPRGTIHHRVRAGTTTLEFITPAVLRSLQESEVPSAIFGEAPWKWQRLESLPEGTVVLQVVPDLKWTGGSYVSVTARALSYPFMIPVTIMSPFMTLDDLFNHPSQFDPAQDLEILRDSWKPVRAAYRFDGEFLQAALFRDGVEISPIDARRDCAKSKVWVARKPDQRPRTRKVRGCWGFSTYPAAAFAPGAKVDVRIVDGSENDSPRIVNLPGDLLARIHEELIAVPLEDGRKERQEAHP